MPVRTAPLLTRLHAEWQRITMDVAELRTAASWQLTEGPMASLDELLERCGFRPGPPVAGGGSSQRAFDAPSQADADAQLLRLLAIAPHEPLAGRIVLQRIMPALCATARRYSTTRAQREAALDDLVANAWTIICTYPIDRRRCFVASNLVRDTTFSTMVRPSRRRSASEVPVPHEDLREDAQVVTIEPVEELMTLLDDALASRSIDADDCDLLRRMLAHGRVEHLAAALGVTPRTIRNHRDAVLHRLRTHVRTAA